MSLIHHQTDAVNNALGIFRHAERRLKQASNLQSSQTISAFNGCVLLEVLTDTGKTLIADVLVTLFLCDERTVTLKSFGFDLRLLLI